MKVMFISKRSWVLIDNTDAAYDLIGAGAQDLHQHGLVGSESLYGTLQFFSSIDMRRIKHGNDRLLKTS